MAYFDKTPSELYKLMAVTRASMLTCPTRYTCDALDRHARLTTSLVVGPALFNVPYPIELVTSASPPNVPDYFITDGIMVVSGRLKGLIEELTVPNVEFFPATVELFDKKGSKLRAKTHVADYSPGSVGGGERLTGYWWMNLWNKVDALDRKESIGQWKHGNSDFTKIIYGDVDIPDYFIPIDRVQTFVLKSPPLEHLYIIEGVLTAIFISPQMFDKLENFGFEVDVHAFNMKRGV